MSIDDTLDSVDRAVDSIDTVAGHAAFYHADNGGIDGSRRSSGLCNQHMFHNKTPILYFDFLSQIFQNLRLQDGDIAACRIIQHLF